jgi:hypothetical protein
VEKLYFGTLYIRSKRRQDPNLYIYLTMKFMSKSWSCSFLIMSYMFAVFLSLGHDSFKMPNFLFGHTIHQVFVYHKAFPMPVLAYKFNVTDPISGQEIDDQSQFISCVCWRGQSSTLLSANSSGNIKVLQMD